jgi:hypothetical protein
MIMMKNLACFLPLILAFTTTAQDSPRTKLAGRSVEMKLVKPDDLSPIPWPKGNVELTETTSTLEGTNTLLKLKANGIAPDSEALTLVYDLNPSIRDLNALPAQTQIRLPSIKTESPEVKRFLHDGYLVELTVDPEIRGELNTRIDALRALAPQIQATTQDAATLDQLQRTIGWFQEIERRFKRRTGPPLRKMTLEQMTDEANQLYSLMQGAIQQRSQLTDTDKQQIAGLFGDMQIAIKEYGQILGDVPPPAEPLYTVTVTIKGTNAVLIDGLRVYYTFNGLFRPLPTAPPIKATGFTQLGSGKSQNFLMKNYQVWAAKDGDPNHPLTPPYALHIDETSTSPISIELSLVIQP